MEDEYDHEACVNAWMKRSANAPSSERLLDAYERGFSVVWRRAHQPLGDVTLMAIADRVLFAAVERFPFLATLQIGIGGVRWEALRKHVGKLHPAELSAGLRFVMVELLTVLGNLTAQILTPALHRELAALETRVAEPASIGEQRRLGSKRRGVSS